ncbi:MAG: hypothetical protein AAF716_13170 [Cyanobacteria bacterium P01_D01_bin.1]
MTRRPTRGCPWGLAQIAITLPALSYQPVVGVVLALAGNWAILPFVKVSDPDAAQVVSMASTFCLQRKEDVRFSAVLTIFLSLFVFVPVAHTCLSTQGRGFFLYYPALATEHSAAGGLALAILLF